MHRNKPAFPGIRIDDDGKTKHEPGMTLRDYWATEFLKMHGGRPSFQDMVEAYARADRMAEARDHDVYM